jgi:hypothetical protein
MSLTLLTQPEDYNFSQNPIPIEVEAGLSTWQAFTPAVPTILKLAFPSSTSDGDTFSVLIGGYTFMFKFESSLTDDSGLYILEAATVNAIYLADVKATMEQNSTFSELVTLAVVAGPAGLTFSAPLELNMSIINGSFGTLTTVNPGTAAIYQENYKLQVKLVNEATSAQICKLQGTPNINSPFECLFEIGGLNSITDSLVSPTLPAFNATAITDCTSNIVELSYEYTEGFGQPAIFMYRNPGDPFFVIRGGLPFPDYPSSNFFTGSIVSLNPLTRKMTSLDAHEYAYVLSLSFAGQVKLKATAIKTDGTTDVQTGSLFALALAANKVYAIPCNIYQTAFVPSLVAEYTLELLDSTNHRLLELGTYVVDKCQQVTHSILYENQYGGFSTLCCDRYLASGIEVAKEEAAKVWKYDYEATQSQSFTFKSNAQRRQKLATRFLPLEEIQQLHYLFTAKEVYLQGEGAYLPVEILTNSVMLYQEGQDMYAIEFEIAFRYDL